VNRIESYPEKPRHLGTVTTKIIELDIVFVSLGSEGYSENNRIQQMVCSILPSTITQGILKGFLRNSELKKNMPSTVIAPSTPSFTSTHRTS